MSAPGRIADTVDRVWRAGWWYVLDLIGVAAIAWATYREYGRWWGIGAVVAGVLATVAVIVQRAHARRALPAVVTYPPWESWPVITQRPPADRADAAVVLAVIDGRPMRRLISPREMYHVAVACSHDRQSPQQIARLLRRSEADVQLLLATAQPAKTKDTSHAH